MITRGLKKMFKSKRFDSKKMFKSKRFDPKRTKEDVQVKDVLVVVLINKDFIY